MPCGGARNPGKTESRTGVTVVDVRPISTPDRVYNIRVAEDHNYFANGVLLHNCDDILNIADQHSEAVLTGVLTWFDQVFYNRVIDSSKDTRVIIMQRVNDRDLAGHLLRRGGWELLSIPMEFDPARRRTTSIGWTDPRTQRGELMCPKVWPEPIITDYKKTLGASAFASQYQQTPTPDGGGILKSHFWQYWKPANLDLPPVRVKLPDGTIEERYAVNLPKSFDLELMSFDTTFKDLKTSDFVVGQVHCVRGANRYIRDQVRGQMDLPATIAAIRELSGHHPEAHLKLIEDKANGPAVIQMLSDEIGGLVAVNPEGGKVGRAAAASIELESGNWFLPHPMIAPWVGNPENPTESGFLAETVLFPFGAHDDICDSWSQGAIRIQKEKIGGVFGVSEKDIQCQPFEIGAKWPRLFGLHISWQEIGAVWIARRPETGEHVAYAEYSVPSADPAQHAAALLKPGDWFPGFIHATAPGRDEKSGYGLVERYRRLGVRHLETTIDTGEAEIVDLADALRNGKLKVFGNPQRLLDSMRTFRRSDAGKLPVENCGPIRALCVAWRCRERMRAPIEPQQKRQDTNWGPDPRNTWMGA